MEINIVKSAGFCFGVKRAIDLAMETAHKNIQTNKIYTIGPIIHNDNVVKELEAKGIKALDESQVSNVKDSYVILRSHGVEKYILEILNKNNNIVVNAICPFVAKIHNYVDMLTKEGYFVIIIGDKGHPEVKAIYSFANPSKSLVVENENDQTFINFLTQSHKKIGIVVQTTQNFENFSKISAKILKMKGEIRIFNSICNATDMRQKETIEVAKVSDIMIVVGGKHSANTKRLYEISKSIQPDTFHIQSKDELNFSSFKNKKRVGITAGASTPQKIIKEVVNEIKNLH